MSDGKREQIEYGDVKVPILRESIAEVYIALQPPNAQPYVVAPHAMDPEEIVRFYAERIGKVEYLQEKMLKRFAKSQSGKCSYQTGDIAYVMGRPFILEVSPVGRSKGVKGGSRGRANISYSIDTEVSHMNLYVIKTGAFDQRKSAFLIYGRAICVKNAAGMAQNFLQRLGCEDAAPAVRMRAMRGTFAKMEAGALWISEDIVPYPVDCLAYAVWQCVSQLSGAPEDELQAVLESVLPGWQRASDILSTRAQPYSNQ